MEEEQTANSDYVRGFNEGYTISKHLPGLAEKLPSDLKDDRGQGFRDGTRQYLNEKEKERLPSWLKSDRLANLNKQPPLSKGKNKEAPDR